MELDDIPNLKGNQYPQRISVSLSSEAKRKLDFLKSKMGKDTAQLVRMLIDDFVKQFDFPEAG